MIRINFMRTGRYYHDYGYPNNRTSHGYWWSTTSSSATNGRYMDTYTSNVRPQVSGSRGNGRAIRCTIRVE